MVLEPHEARFLRRHSVAKLSGIAILLPAPSILCSRRAQALARGTWKRVRHRSTPAPGMASAHAEGADEVRSSPQTQRLRSVPDVEIDDGVFKYVLIKVRALL